MRFGVNYTPRVGWFHSWLDFDRAAVADDMAAIAALGADHVRIFPLWPLLQPNRGLIRSRAIGDVLDVVSAAHEAGLTTSVDVLQGHLSSFDFLPSWVTTWHRARIFTDARVIDAQKALISALCRELRDAPGAEGVSVGNEFYQFAASRHPDPSAVDETGARSWTTIMLDTAARDWSDGTHTHSYDDDLWFEDDQPFTPELAVGVGASTTVHSWVFGRVGPRFGKGAPELDWFARYLCELAAAWGPAGRPVWLQEVGAPSNYVDESDAPDFLLRTLGILMGENGGGVSPGLEAVTWWCSHDVSPDLLDFPDLEYSLGLLDTEGSPKALGEAFAQAVASWGGIKAHGRDRRPALVLDAPGWARSDTDATGAFFDAWMRTALAGEPARIELDHSRRVAALVAPEGGNSPH